RRPRASGASARRLSSSSFLTPFLPKPYAGLMIGPHGFPKLDVNAVTGASQSDARPRVAKGAARGMRLRRALAAGGAPRGGADVGSRRALRVGAERGGGGAAGVTRCSLHR